jgi:hypothetical protein
MATADKYDRQLRLWGANGQRKLMTSHILLINATAVGTETLKNLVLPGLGSFTILDNSGIESNDLGNNFFTTSGPYRGQSAVENLCEMNPDVKGTFLNSDLSTELEQGHQSPPSNISHFLFYRLTILTKIFLGDSCESSALSLSARRLQLLGSCCSFDRRPLLWLHRHLSISNPWLAWHR